MSKQRKYSMFNIIWRLTDLVVELFKQWQVLFVYAGFLTVLNVAFGLWHYACKDGDTSFWCYSLPQDGIIGYGLSLFYILGLLWLALAFVYDFYNAAFKGQKFQVMRIFMISKAKLKTMVFIFAYALCLVLPLLITLGILLKKANPDWRIEFGFFCILFAVMMLEFLAIRIFVVCSRYLQHSKMPSWRQALKETAGRAYAPILLFLILVAIENLLQMNISRQLNVLMVRHNILEVAALTEFIDSFMKLVYLALLILLTRAQDELLAATPADEAEKGTPVLAETTRQKVETKAKTTAKTRRSRVVTAKQKPVKSAAASRQTTVRGRKKVRLLRKIKLKKTVEH